MSSYEGKTPVFLKIKELLDENSIKYEVINHHVVRTSEEAAKIRDTKMSDGAKALVLGKGPFYQFVVRADMRLSLKKVKQILETKNISLASPDDVLKMMNCVIGSVPPFGNLFGITVYTDTKLVEKEWFVFSAGSLTKSIKIKVKDYMTLVKPIVADFHLEK